jgi:alcohol dehydrogenase
MKALVFHGPGERSWDSVPDPKIIEATDAIVRIDTATICGTDLHILKGDVPEVEPGTILGHEAVGTVVEKGSAVTTLEVGDRILVSCITACGRCRFCKEGHYGLCTGGGGWILGHLINGLQADFARVPFADTSTHKLPEEIADDQALFLADILPTSYEVGVLNGGVVPGDTVAIVGAGPIGLAAIMTARLYTPGRIVALDVADARLQHARSFGADVTVNNGEVDAIERIMELTDGLGCRRRHRGGRHTGDVRALRRHRQARRACRKRGRPRPTGDAPSREALDQGRHHHHRTRRHVDDAAATQAHRGRAARSDPLRDTQLRAGRHGRGV